MRRWLLILGCALCIGIGFNVVWANVVSDRDISAHDVENMLIRRSHGGLSSVKCLGNNEDGWRCRYQKANGRRFTHVLPPLGAEVFR
jgi:hypothetical protein